jgi:hypothetical protein
MLVREPVVAGLFYPANAASCRREVAELLRGISQAPLDGLPVAGLVPHAGWAYSGAVAAAAFAALTAGAPPEVVVLFGGAHRYLGRDVAVFSSGRWETPLGPVEVDARLAERVLGATSTIVEDAYAHEEEHSLEVQLPFVRYLFPEARILPFVVPPTDHAAIAGAAVARTLTAYRTRALILGTTDLTHYGPGYGFIDRGLDDDAYAWMHAENDGRFLELVCAMRTEEVIGEALVHRNACSGGAVAATMAAAAGLGARRGVLLAHTNSRAVVQGRGESPGDDAVGYAGVVFVTDD